MTSVTRRDFLRKAALVLGATGVASMAGLGQGHALSENAPSVPRPGNLVIPASYVIFQDNGRTYAQNGRSGFSDYSGIDATAVIRSSLASLKDGGLVFLKKGTYRLTGKLTVTDSVQLMGEKGSKVEVENFAQSPDNPFNMLEVSGSNATIEGIEFDGNTANNPNLAGTTSQRPPANPDMQSGITVDKGSWVKIRNCLIHDIWNAGIWLIAKAGNVENVEIAGCRIESTGLSVSHASTTNPPQSANAIYAYRRGGTTSRATIHDNLVKDTYGRGIYLHFDTDSMISNNMIFTSRAYTTETAGIAADDLARRMIIEGNNISGYSPGIFVVWSSSEDFIVEGNYCANAQNAGGAGSGIMVTNANSGLPPLRSVVLRGNICRNNACSGISVAASEVLIQGNICYNNNRDTGDVSTRRAGILVQGVPGAEVGGITITGNRCFDDQVLQTQDYGISVSQKVNKVTNVAIISNDLRGNRRGGIGEVITSSLRIADNMGHNPQGIVAVPVGPSPFVYTNNDAVSEVIYIIGGIVTEISKNDETVFDTTPATIWLEPGDSLRVVHADPPKMIKDRK